MDEPAAPIDEPALEAIRDLAQTHSLVNRIQTEQTGSTLSLLIVDLDRDRYPDQVADVRLEIQWYRNDDYNFHYVEHQSSNRVWQCRWDRHPNSHTTRAHFHPPPDASAADAVADQPPDRHPSALFTRTMANARDRISDLWETVE
ncbi:hypothetical protein [Halosimplex pelagicum]|uniref:Uncharacterized protein n=1 Tax=Halosimplex pelagicum TaxID=869886 RepID=A0A7D5PA60_9EURY|nr:hypothetical protein [Halosimplex pelagicum]QLH81302.1 hypothetical protein HZS54_06510 [Halosimplex pelagicum]